LCPFCLQSYADWRIVCASHHNVLLEGPEAATAGVLLLLKRHLRQPVLRTRHGAPLELPTAAVGTLILEEVAALSAKEQTRLLQWLDDDAHERPRIVSTTARPLFPLLALGLFDAALYYRLNVMLLQVDRTTPLHAPDAKDGAPSDPRSLSV
jgi:hypothetical protein